MKDCYIFNIGSPATDTWWQRCLNLGVITAGYKNQAGDEGDRILRSMEEGDWVIGYANKHGYVGLGTVGPTSSYRLVPLDELPDRFESNHRHWRSVNWVSYVMTLDDAVSIKEARRHPPPCTKQRVKDINVVKTIATALATRGTSAPYAGVDEVPVKRADQTFFEGAVQQVWVNKYERDQEARRACIARWGTTCNVCRDDLTEKYGVLAAGFIHVHHLKALYLSGGQHEIVPERDLRPVCPNCHSMLHRQIPPMEIEELQRIIEAESAVREKPLNLAS